MSDAARWHRTLSRHLTLLKSMLEGIDDDTALRPLITGGSTLNWVVGHLTVSRDSMLRAAGAAALGDEAAAALYELGTHPPGPDRAIPLADLVALFERQGERLNDALDRATEEALAAPSGVGDSTVRNYLDFMVWHEAYHMGQTVLYRRAAGLASPIH